MLDTFDHKEIGQAVAEAISNKGPTWQRVGQRVIDALDLCGYAIVKNAARVEAAAEQPAEVPDKSTQKPQLGRPPVGKRDKIKRLTPALLVTLLKLQEAGKQGIVHKRMDKTLRSHMKRLVVYRLARQDDTHFYISTEGTHRLLDPEKLL